MLEVMEVMAHSSTALENDILFLFNGGNEEQSVYNKRFVNLFSRGKLPSSVPWIYKWAQVASQHSSIHKFGRIRFRWTGTSLPSFSLFIFMELQNWLFRVDLENHG
jgi:hypothetical protein